MWDGETTPFVVGCNKNWAVCSQPFGQYYYTSGIGLTEVGYNGPAFNYNEGQVCYVYNIANRITAARTIPSKTAWFVAAGNVWYNFGNQANMNCGVGYQTIYCMSEGTSVCSNNLFQIKNTSAGNTASGTGHGCNFSANQQQEFNFGFDLFLNKTVPSYNLQVKCNQNAQGIFGGYASETAP
jgi:hypothetical protein